MEYSRPAVLSIAGLDPSGGAGLLADVKTFEQHQCMGFGVATAITVQTEDRFHSVHWLPLDKIKAQAAPLFAQYDIRVIKIGIVESIQVLQDLVKWIRDLHADAFIVWDTVLSASASGFRFIDNIEKETLADTLKEITLITPNTNEALLLAGLKDEKEAAQKLSAYCNVLLKGGHAQADVGTDYLYHDGKTERIPPVAEKAFSKHGSGCILSSAIAANLALGCNVYKASILAKTYTEARLNSNSNLLAYHNV